MKNNTDYQIAIIGGGIVGLTLAATLAASKMRICVIEASKPDVKWDEKNYDLRVVALTRASQRIFQQLRCWQTIVEQRVSPYYSMSVWDEQGSGTIQFDSAILNEADLGHIVENRVIQTTLWQHLQHCDNVTIIEDKLQNFTVEETKVHIELEQQTLTSQLLVGADGGRSKIRELAHIDVIHWPYQQHALVCNVVTEKAHNRMARQRFLKTGSLAFLPLTESNTSSIVWSTTEQQAAQLKTMDEAEFKQQLAQAFEYCLGSIEKVSARATFPLHMLHAKNYVKSRIALIGDAAHTIHPLAGQGANLGILDAACLSEILINALTKQQDIGHYHVLRRYERWRKSHNVLMIALMEGFKRLFNNDQLLLIWLRNNGLNLVNHSNLVKEEILNYAMGLKGDLPTIAMKNH